MKRVALTSLVNPGRDHLVRIAQMPIGVGVLGTDGGHDVYQRTKNKAFTLYFADACPAGVRPTDACVSAIGSWAAFG
jgi:hypothetical protein